jgi:hypothetical protein
MPRWGGGGEARPKEDDIKKEWASSIAVFPSTHYKVKELNVP